MYSNFCLVFFFILSLFHPIPCASSKLKWCETLFQCGNIIAGFPFWGGNRPEPCGHPLLELHCNLNITSLIISNQEYHVFHLNQTSNTLTLARPDLLGPFCSAKFITTTFLSEVFALPETYKSLTVYYRCNPQLHYLSSYTCPDSGLVAVSQNPDYQYSCQNSFTVNVPTSFVPKGKKLNLTHLEIILRKGFDLKVVIDEKACQKCSSFRGVCSFDSTKQVCCNVTLESGVKCSQLYPPTAGELYRRCSALFSCGNQDKILYPFWIPGREECGHPDFQLNCSGGFAELSIASVKFRILEANYTSRIIRLARSDYSSNLCPINPLNVPINEKVLPLAHDTELLTLYYDCPDYSSEFLYSGCIEELGCVNHKKSYYVTKNISIVNSGSLNKLKGLCRRNVSIPASGPALVTLQRIPTPDNLKMALEEGFELGVNQECLMCIDSGGACGYNQTSSVFVCYCKNGSHNRSCYLKADELLLGVITANELYRRCGRPFSCCDQSDLIYPFWIPGREECGHPDFKLNCSGEFAEINISSVKFRISDSNLKLFRSDYYIRLVRSDYIGDLFPPNPLNAQFNKNVVYFADDTELLTIYYDCPHFSLPITGSSYVGELGYGDDVRDYYVTKELSSPLLDGIRGLLNNFKRMCKRNVSIPASGSALETLQRSPTPYNLKKALEQGFQLHVVSCFLCVGSGGACGYNQTSSMFVCYCKHGHGLDCGWGSSGADLAKTIAAVLSWTIIAVILLLCRFFGVQVFRKKITAHDLKLQKLKALIPLKHYTYAEVKKITKSFAEVVGRGGFGIVYSGTLSDGCMVAVKVLKESKGNDSEDFINEVASMSQTSHVNIVSLLGFCCEGSERAIIYEYLGNGSLAKFITDKTSTNVDLRTLYGIALGVARGLEYLHYGCKTRIVHFDIKPQNVLLDENLCPKVADFGLAKLCKKEESIMSLLDMRGTIGYIAPEMISRVYGNISHKSDVYSYGMLVLEMIGARKKERVDQNSESNPSSMYFPEWIYKDLENGDSGNYIENAISNEEEEIAKKMTLVGLWCIQSSPSNRPSMNRVVEMMDGSLEALEVPPRPVLQQVLAAPLSESFGISGENSSASEILLCSTESSSL